eukprot:Gb_07398 [translate_table: standard]
METIAGTRLITGTHEMVGIDQQLGSSLKEEGSEGHNPAEDAKPEIINTWDLMEGLEDEEASSTLEKIDAHSEENIPSYNSKTVVESIDESAPACISRKNERSKSLENFHTVEEYDAFLARSKRHLWDRNTKRHLYYLQQGLLENITESGSSSLHKASSRPPQKSMAPIEIDWNEDPKCDEDYVLEKPNPSPSPQVSFGQSDRENEVSNRVNNDTTEKVSEDNENQENNHIIQMAAINDDAVGGNLEENQSTDRRSIKKSLHVRAKSKDLGGINIPSTPDFSAVASLREWLFDGGHLYSPGVTTTPRFGYSGIWSQSSRPNDGDIACQAASNGHETETFSSPDFSSNKQTACGELDLYIGSSLYSVEKEHWDCPLFDPELLASLEKSLEELSEEEQHVLRQIDEHSNSPNRNYHLKEGEDGLLQSSGNDIQIPTNFPSYEEEFSSEDPKSLEKSLEELSEEEHHVLRQIDEHSTLPNRNYQPKEGEDGLLQSSGDDIQIPMCCPSYEEEFSSEDPKSLEKSLEELSEEEQLDEHSNLPNRNYQLKEGEDGLLQSSGDDIQIEVSCPSYEEEFSSEDIKS